MYEGAPETPHILQEAPVHLIDNHICNSSEWYAGVIVDTHVCAGYQEGGIDTCQGDSGGPLVCKDPVGEYYWLVGVTSWGYGCARMQQPGVYSAVQRYYNWILSHISTLQESSRRWSRSSSGFSQLPRPRPKQSRQESLRKWGHSYSGYSQYHKPVPTQSVQPDPCPYPTHKLVEFFTGVQQLLSILKGNKP
ncbi:PREDICTED: acrosin-like [Tinamus guttatus]|uniref:acrosin-like n=1 Tax=Tinamus guttatus TaxID=94827 RepID=UPI00052F306D|nr:PREDICTED: acrosin-like [Tinamus guttatus]